MCVCVYACGRLWSILDQEKNDRGKRIREIATNEVAKKPRQKPADATASFGALVEKALEQQAKDGELEAKRLALEEKKMEMEVQMREKQQQLMMEVSRVWRKFRMY